MHMHTTAVVYVWNSTVGPSTVWLDQQVGHPTPVCAGTPSVHQLMNYKKNGDPFINYLSITPIHDSEGHVTHFMGIQSDISDLVNHKKAEMAAKHEAAQARVSSCLPCTLPLTML